MLAVLIPDDLVQRFFKVPPTGSAEAAMPRPF